MLLSEVIHGDEELERRLEELASRAQDLSPAWERVMPRLRSEERELFLSRGHGRWPSNRPSTIRRKGRNSPNIDQGRLFRALTLDRTTGSVRRRSKTQMTFGVNDQRIFWARFVGKQRPFIVDEKTAERIGSDAVRDWLDGAR